MSTTTLQRWGNSHGIRIPRLMLDALNWENNEKLIITADNKRLIIEKLETRKNIIELFDGFEGNYASTEMDWGTPMGEELW